MRELKFRAWDKDMNTMHDISGFITFKQFTEVHFGTSGFKRGQYELMQYTGLKDKHGTEIYSGDVISRKRHKDQNNWASELVHDMDYADTVIFHHGAFISKENGKTIHSIIRPFRITDNIEHEVIGNIHQNPELLTN